MTKEFFGKIQILRKMKKHTAKEWLIAVRPWSFPASAMPVIVTLAYLFARHDDVNWVNGVWALLNIIVFHAAGNTWSDCFDYRKGVDAEDTFGARTLTSGMFSFMEILTLSTVLLAVAVAGGVGLWLRTGMPLLYIGLGGVLCTVLYPILKYNALGDLVIFCAYALLPTLGTVYAAASVIDPGVLMIAVPVGSITVAILHCNNLRDIGTDSRAHISTFAMKIGPRASVAIYCLEILGPFVWLTVCAFFGVVPWWCLLVWGAFFPALQNVRTEVAYLKTGASAISGLDEATARLQLLFSFLLAAGFVISGI